jgi:chromosome segregation protein
VGAEKDALATELATIRETLTASQTAQVALETRNRELAAAAEQLAAETATVARLSAELTAARTNESSARAAVAERDARLADAESDARRQLAEARALAANAQNDLTAANASVAALTTERDRLAGTRRRP